MRMAPTMDRMDRDMDMPMVSQMLDFLLIPNQSVWCKWEKEERNCFNELIRMFYVDFRLFAN